VKRLNCAAKKNMGVSTFFDSYPYLVSSISSAVLFSLASWRLLDRQQNKLVFLAGLTNLPSFIFVFLFEGVYWMPVRIGGWNPGVEDALCSYAIGALAWLVVAFRSDPLIPDTTIGISGIVRRYSIVAVFSALIFFPLYFFGIDPMSAFAAMCFIVGGYFFIVLPQLRNTALKGLWRLPVIYLTIVKIYFLIWPDFIYQWNGAGFWGRPVFGIPFGEFAWAISFGFYWPIFIGYVFRLKREGVKK
jgi:hypothetical protein